MWTRSSAELWALVDCARYQARLTESPSHPANAVGWSPSGNHGSSRTGFGHLLGGSRPYILGRHDSRATDWFSCRHGRRTRPDASDPRLPLRSGGLPGTQLLASISIHPRARLLHWVTRSTLRLDKTTLRLGVPPSPGLPRSRFCLCDAGGSGMGPPRSMRRDYSVIVYVFLLSV